MIQETYIYVQIKYLTKLKEMLINFVIVISWT